MERPELRDRVRQELAKRQDGLLSLVGFDFGRSIGRSGRQGTRFFFTPHEVDSRIALLRQRLPEQAKEIVSRAENLLKHRFDLLGYKDLDYGSPIDWHLDLVHGKRAPRKVFHRVGYLDFQQVGDSKVTWELNRHQHFMTLAKAYRLSGDTRYVDEILRQWRHWWSENPYPVGINWASSLEAAFRSMAWLWTWHLLQDAPGVPDFRDEWLRGLALHGRHIERYLSTYFSPNTHLLGEGVALLFLGVLCPELEPADRWRDAGWRIVHEESERQVQADGFHFEQSTYYHVYALDFFLHAAILASVNDINVPSEFETRIEKMLNALQVLSCAGAPPRFGDDDGGRLFDASRNRAEHLLDPLATGAILFNRGDLKAAAMHVREETIWLLGAEGVRAWDELEAVPLLRESAALPASGFYVLCSESPASQLVVDCGPLGTQSGGHGHADALSITLHSKGQEVLIDPGTCEYAGESGDRNLFRGTRMHNTVQVDGCDQSEPGTAFSWRRLTQSTTDRWIRGYNFDFFAGRHDGYERLAPPVTHRRFIFSARNGIYLVRDVVEGSGVHQIEISWHLGSTLQQVEEGLYRAKGASHGLAIMTPASHGWAEQVGKEAFSPAYGEKATSTVLRFSQKGNLPHEFCTLLVTLDEVQQRPGRFERMQEVQAGVVSAFRFVTNSEVHQFCFSETAKDWKSGAVASDAQFVCWSKFAGQGEQRVILAGGTRAEVDGLPPLRLKREVEWCEWSVKSGGSEFFCSDPDALEGEPALQGASPGQ